MITKREKTYFAKIYMAGDPATAKQIIRKMCFDVGLCVSIENVEYIYTGGEESGYCATVIQYPRFPCDESDIREKAKDLAIKLMEGTFQLSCCLVFSDETIYIARDIKEKK